MDWSALARQLEGRLVLPGDTSYPLLRQPFNQRIAAQPAAVARCAGEEDVVACIRFAAANDVAVTCRSGGHSAEGYCAIDGALMIDQSAMQTISVDAETGLVHVGAGASWGQVDIATYPRRRASPGGGCATVGVAGLTQGGGIGPIARTYGMTIDNLVSARLVTPRDERVIVADEHNNADVFWALRGGGGGNFGAVTQFTYRMHEIDPRMLGGTLVYSWDDAPQMFAFYRDLMTRDDDTRLTCMPLFFFGPQHQPMAAISAFYTGTAEQGLAYVESALKRAGMPDPVNGPAAQNLVPETLLAYTGTESTTAWPGTGQYWRSGLLLDDFSDQAIQTVIDWFPRAPIPPDKPTRTGAPHAKQDDLTFGFIESLGGAIADIGRSDTAFWWRDHRYSFTFIGVYDPADDGWRQQTKAWADAFRQAMEPHLSEGVYVNYVQADLADWKHAYYGGHYDRLRAIKAEVDPGHLLRFPQDVLQ